MQLDTRGSYDTHLKSLFVGLLQETLHLCTEWKYIALCYFKYSGAGVVPLVKVAVQWILRWKEWMMLPLKFGELPMILGVHLQWLMVLTDAALEVLSMLG